MVDLTFASRATHFVPLALMKHVADGSSSEPPAELQYIGNDGVKAIKGMALVRKARLSVQRVDERTWGIIEMLAEKGGWDKIDLGKKKLTGAGTGGKAKAKKKTRVEEDSEEGTEEERSEAYVESAANPKVKSKQQSRTSGRKRKAKELDTEGDIDEADTGVGPLQRSTRARK